MKTAVLIFFLLLVLTAVVSVGFFYVEFRSWPPFVWAQRLRRRVETLEQERRNLKNPDPSGVQATMQRATADLFRGHLRTVPLSALTAYAGIGFGAVERLENAGCRSLADLTEFRFESVAGFGPARSTDLRSAVRQLVHQARVRFDAGACPEAQEYRRKLSSLREEERQLAQARDRRLAAVEEALHECVPLEEIAKGITFQNYLFHREIPGLVDGVLAAPLPYPREVVPIPPPVPPQQPRIVLPDATRVAPIPPEARPASVATSAKAIERAARPANANPVPDVQKKSTAPPPPLPHPLLAKLRAFVRFGFVVARADGRIAKDERKEIRSFLGDSFGGDQVLVRFIDPEMETVEASPPEEGATFSAIAAVTTEAEKKSLYAFAERVADASGERNDREIAFLARLKAAFGIADIAPVVAAAKPAPSVAPVSPDARGVVDIPPGVELTVELIRRKYAMAFDKNDPAKAAALGAEYVKVAEGKRAAARAAAEALIAPFGVPLDSPAPPPPPSDIRHNPDLDDIFGKT